MVPDSRATARADQLRPLNQPRPVQVLTQDGQPVALIANGRHCSIEQVRESWAIEDEWWRQPISRRYYQFVLADGSTRTVYHDATEEAWYAQTY